MSSLSQAEIRVLTKMVQILRQEHKQVFQYQDPELAAKVGQAVQQLDDPILSALWQSLSDSTRAQVPASSKPGEQKVRLYRGQVVDRGQTVAAEAEPKVETPPPQQVAEPEEPREGGRYIVYRGQKQWVADS